MSSARTLTVHSYLLTKETGDIATASSIGIILIVIVLALKVAKMPAGIMSSARTLTVHSYLLTKETGDIATASSIGIILIVIVLALNTLAKFAGKRLSKAKY